MSRLFPVLATLLLAPAAMADTAAVCDHLISAESEGDEALDCVVVTEQGCDVRLANDCSFDVDFDEVDATWAGTLAPGDWVSVPDGERVVTLTRADAPEVAATLALSTDRSFSTPDDGPHGCSTSPGELSWMGLVLLLAVRRVRR
ncbi:MAG: hypothetical protein EP330_26285 [Deltaproteobacteria bacterium]|nr:MAG: hypothetical protein EP330_26285 [Deltaproteobacteria bacterium]